MPAETLSCPMCGAAAATDASRCEHCGARLATVACPSCFGMMFIGQKFCPHCGAKGDRENPSENAKPAPCPRCKTSMEAITIGMTSLRECPSCEGTWTDGDTLRQICENRDQQSVVLGMATHLPSNDGLQIEKQIRYLPCPACGQLMNRVNFANFSNVIVDVCNHHGTFFDRDELRRIVEFIRDGGLEKARSRDKENLEADRRRAASAIIIARGERPMWDDAEWHGAVSSVARAVLDIFE
ncbi:MAG TPA: zf-TFIIB domain-containing protein [Verrucomicrobiae bacterium]